MLKELDVSAISLLLLESENEQNGHHIRLGQLEPPVHRQLEEWEELLRSAHSSDLPEEISYKPALLSINDSDFIVVHIYLLINQVVRGSVSLVLTKEQALTENELIDLEQTIGLFAGNGLRAQYLQQTRQQLERVSFVYQVSQAITSTLDLTDVLNQTTELATFVLNAQAATLYRIDRTAKELIFMYTQGEAAQVLEEERMPIDKGIAGHVATMGEPLVVNEVARSEFWNSEVDTQTGFQTRSILCVPLLVQDRTIGVLEVLNKEDPDGFTAEDENWLTVMGQQVAIALENAQLYQELRAEQERIIKAQEEVRHQLARDLHDNTAQMLSLIIMNLDLLRTMLDTQQYAGLPMEIDRIEDIARQANREIRTLLFELHPIILETQGLIPALKAYHRQLNLTLDTLIHLDANLDGLEMSPENANNIFSIIQESVNNIRKHAKANNIWIRVSIEEDTLRFQIADDGAGFDYSATMKDYDSRGSFGLLTMQERAQLLNGKLNIQSPYPRCEKGTVVSGTIPLSQIATDHSVD